MNVKKKAKILVIILGSIFILVLIPLLVTAMMSVRLINTDTSNEWIGFWGGYLGSIIGGLITLYVLFRTLEDSKNTQERELKEEFCKYICELTGKLCGAINREHILLLKIADGQGEPGDVYEALMKRSEAMELFQICEVQLISRQDNKLYKDVKTFMDCIHTLQCDEDEVELKESYNELEKQCLEKQCDKIKNLLGKMREDAVYFLEKNL